MPTRRVFLRTGALTGAGLFLPWGKFFKSAYADVLQGGSLDPLTIPKYAMPLVKPPAMPPTRILSSRGQAVDYYEIAVRQFQQQVLPSALPKTTVWSYGSVQNSGTFNFPAFTIEGKFGRPVRVKWINQLVNSQGNFLPHLLPVDQTLHWANPPGPRDSRGTNPNPYTGPVPIVTHVHGAHTTQDSDGYAEAWYLPNAKNIPAGFFKTGTWYEKFKGLSILGNQWSAGTAVFQYPNDQWASTLWYHDHTLGMTRLNVYAGPAGFYLLRGGAGDQVGGTLPGPAPGVGANPFGTYYEIPIAIQDRSFNSNGSLFYPPDRAFFDGFEGPYIPDPGSDISPIWNPEAFFNTMVVNGRTWPFLEVEPRRYRFRFLNGCNSRFLILKMVTNATARPGTPFRPFWQIGAEGGFLPAPVELDQLLMSPAERADVIIDFTGLSVGTEIYLINEGPDEPFGGGVPGIDFPFADPGTSGQVMKLKVVALNGTDLSTPPAELSLPPRTPLPAAVRSRQVSLNEEDSALIQDVGPRAALLGTLTSVENVPTGVHKAWDDAITENPGIGDTEVWEMYNFTEDAHPIHIHEVQFEVVNRQPFDPETGALGFARPPEDWETGTKDTVIAYPGEITRVKATFDLPGRYVWHCHIVEHEDNEMMRPYRVG